MNPSNLTVSRVRCELYRSAARTRHVKPLTPHLCFSPDVPSVLFHVTDLKLSNRDSRATLQRTRNVVRNLRRPPCTVDESAKPKARAPSFQAALRVRRSIPNEREVYQRRSEHQRRFEANETRERERRISPALFSAEIFRLLESPASDVTSFRSTQQPVRHAITSAAKICRRPRVNVYPFVAPSTSQSEISQILRQRP